MVNDNVILPALVQIFNHTSSFEELLELLIRRLVESLPSADAGIVYIYDKSHRQLVAEASYGYNHNDIKHGIRLKEGVPGQCYTQRKPLLLASVMPVIKQTAILRPANLECHHRVAQGLPPPLSLIAIPLMLRDKILGVILLEHYKKEHTPFNEADLGQLEALGHFISLMIDDKRLYLELKHTKRSYRELLGKLIARSEEERKQIAREIHDEVNQLLLSVKLNLESIESTLPPDSSKALDRLELSRSQINQVLNDLHELSLNLRPPVLDDLGLSQALEWYVHRLSKEAGLPVKLEVVGLSQRRPAPIIEIELFRIAQEALSNVIKHGQATSASVKLSFGKSRLVLVVKDNGTGFNSDAIFSMSGEKQNLGLLGIMERAERCGGNLKIDSALGRGTRLRVEIPVSSYDWGAY